MGITITFPELANKLQIAIQAKAANVPDFNHGAIVIRFVPYTETARLFLGGFDTDCEIELSYHIKPVIGFEQGVTSYTRPAGWRGDDSNPEVNCRSYADLKIGAAAYALKHNYGRRSSDIPNAYNTYGRENSRGCVVFDIQSSTGSYDNVVQKNHLRVYVSVSGATGEEDEICALAAQPVLQDFANSLYIDTENQFVLVAPSV